MSKWNRIFKKAAAILMTACLAGTCTDTGAFSLLPVYAAAEEKEVILSFEALPEEVSTQEIPVGAEETELVFPEELTVTLLERSSPENPNATLSDAEKSASFSNAVKNASSSDADEDDELPDGEIFDDMTPEVTGAAAVLRIEDWKLNKAFSSTDSFTAETAGESFVFEPVLPKGYLLSDEAEVPRISILVGAEGMLSGVSAQEPVTYIRRIWSGGKVVENAETANWYKLMSEVEDSDSTQMFSGTYVVRGSLTFNKRLRLAPSAQVTLVLCDGSSLTLENGIGVNITSELIICGQREDSGVLKARKSSDDTPIGADRNMSGGSIEICGGHVIATAKSGSTAAAIGSAEGSGDGGSVRIYGGEVEAIAEGYGAAIGGGEDSISPEIVIYGGTVDAVAVSGAAIGTGDSILAANLNYNAKPITIYGGTVNANGGGAGIGGGNNVQNPDIYIYDGNITATSVSNGQESAAAIGSGRYADQTGEIVIYDGQIVATSLGGAGIGAGARCDAGDITIREGVIIAVSTNGGAGIGGGRRGGSGGNVTIYNGSVVAAGMETNEQDQMLSKFNQMAKNFAAHRHNRRALGIASLFDFVGAVVFAASDDESGAGIGGGCRGKGGTVRIYGGDVVASASVGKACAIGHGTGNSSKGSLELHENATVYTGADEHSTSYIAKENRVAACQDHRFALILICRHESCNYTVTETHHTGFCPVCREELETEEHKWTETAIGRYCTVCRFREDYCTVEFIKTDNCIGEMFAYEQRVPKGEGYLLPECGYTAHDGKAFVGWDVKMDGAEAGCRKPGDWIIVTGNTTLTPVWEYQYTVYFDSDGGTETGTQKLLYGERVIEPADPVKEGFTFQGWYEVRDEYGHLNDNPFSFSIPLKEETNKEITLKAVWASNYEITTFEGATGSFNGRIKLNFYFNFPKVLLEDEYAYVTLTNAETGREVKDWIRFTDFYEGRGFKFSIDLAAKEASDKIIAKVFDSQGNEFPIRRADAAPGDPAETSTSIEETLMRYLDWLADPDTEVPDNEKRLGATAKDYCTAAQIYFKYHADGMTVSDAVKDLSADTLSGYAAVRTGELPEGVSILGISGMLETDNTLRLYYSFDSADPADLTFRIDGSPAALRERQDGERYLSLNGGVWPERLQDAHTYSVSNGTNTYTFTASVLTYARACARETDQKVSDLGKALYLYNRAAVAVFDE